MGVVIAILVAIIIGLIIYIVIKFSKKQEDTPETQEKLITVDQLFVFSKDCFEMRLNGYIVFEITNDLKYKKLGHPCMVPAVFKGIVAEIVGARKLDDIITNRATINGELTTRLEEFIQRWGYTVIAAGIDHVEIAKEALKGITDKTYIECIKQAGLDERCMGYLKLKTLEKCSDGTATMVLGSECMDALKDDANKKK
jgi:type III secretory pathway component EscS